ncbi:hypothetical protein NE237_004887 [Protea cynaroides]|uniref:Glycosyltransferase family 92 protein n=1 Tax=Protea cynaroides TaxID=273540 RepID=A0A9Q0QTY4_9MAGN|nr:hypothetical protein NE237_004887 [Protea cynaroides]
MAIVMARDAGMDWIIHLDTDELLHPAGAREYSLRQLLLDVPGDVDIVVFPNYESCVERDDIKEPFSEVSMFKKNYDHLTKDIYYGLYTEATRGNPNYFLTYGNGKSAARIQDNLRPNGAHRWYNYMKTPNEIKMDQASVLHYTYTKFSDLTSRRDRCVCKPTEEDVKRCFILEFDRNFVLIISWANLGFYNSFDCNRGRNAPMAIIKGLKESGVFSSVIASAKTTISKEMFLSSVESSNSTRGTGSKVMSLRKFGSSGESQATARNVLEITGTDSHPEAVPPWSPPGMDDIDLQTL